MKRLASSGKVLGTLVGTMLGVAASETLANQAVSAPQFLSAVQFSIQEASPQLTHRSQELIRQSFAKTIVVVPQIKAQSLDARVQGNEMVFYMVSDTDPQPAMREMLSLLVERLNGQVRARGRMSAFRAGLTHSRGGYLETVVNDDHTAVVSLKARAVPMRDLFKQLGAQIKDLSYVLPGDCADHPVNWSFEQTPQGPRPLNAVIEELAVRNQLKLDRRGGTHILTGTCSAPADSAEALDASPELIPEPDQPMPQGFVAAGFAPTSQHVFVPLRPIGD